MSTFLLKTEPGEYSFADLERDGRCVWDGVTNNAALIAIRAMTKGDDAFIYHTGDEKAIVGLARVIKGAYEDPKRRGVTARGEPRFAVVELAPVATAKSPFTLSAIKADPRFAEFPLVTQGRLSVMAVPPALGRAIRAACGLQQDRS